MSWTPAIIILASFALISGTYLPDSPAGRKLGLFSVITFANEGCLSSTNLNGTCYTADECETKKGKSQGTCAQGYGVCCVFSLTCGQSASENVTYFEGTAAESGSCSIKICKSTDSVCQLRLDFTSFAIAGPSVDIASKFKALAGAQATMGKLVNTATQCLADTFAVTGSNRRSNTICGMNDGAHMYVDAADGCNTLMFQFMGTFARKWNIKTTQLACDSASAAPLGCNQYFTGATAEAGTIQTYNFAGNQHLASQDQTFCIRREKSNCRICYWAAALTDFQISGKTNAAKGFTKECCSYGAKGEGANGFDCVIIPGAMKEADAARISPKVCGQNAGLVEVDDSAAGVSICSTQVPFRVQFLSDAFENAEANGEGLKMNKGFKLSYKQDATRC